MKNQKLHRTGNSKRKPTLDDKPIAAPKPNPFPQGIDLRKNQVLNAVLQRLQTPPVGPVLAQYYFDTVLNRMRVWDGVEWQDQALQGPQGPRGVQGDSGDLGPAGAEGPPGGRGPRGDVGPTGATGDTGAQGAEGSQGPVGAQGSQGANGETGDQGITGDIGAQGPEGPQGASGTTLRKFAATIGDDSSTDFDIVHNLNMVDILVQVYDIVTGAQVKPDKITIKNTTTVTIAFNLPHKKLSKRVVIIG